MDESNARVELWIARETLFDARHPDQNQTDAPVVKDVPHLLKPCHFEPIRFVDDKQSSRIRRGAGHSHRAIPLLIESILGVDRLDTSVTIWVLFGVAQLFGAMKESPHSRVFVSPYSFDYGIMQQAAGLADGMLQMAWRADNRRSVEDNSAFTYLLEERLGLGLMVPICLDFIPVGIMAGRNGFAHPRRAITQPDIAIAFARIAEFGEPPVFKSFD